ncbi:MAG TPA: amidohydrolase family protein [Trinickia sp.]|uniref:amidohydrolase family protein n=1 Tax=Trinickia sp. TaxID=2571163 RepID=UPI002C34667C|nr:amidohydrolase family protein [Trinickia sp.]HVW52855.1 amidohydrolase family protein [Trinickia sp.]
MLTTTALGACADTPKRAGAGKITAIDTHAHVFSHDLPLAQRRRYAPAYDAPLSRYLAQLDAHDVSHGVLIQPSFLGTDNRYLTQSIAQAPQRLRGIAVIDPAAVAAEPGQLDALARAGIVGIRLNLFSLPDPDYTSAVWQATLEKIASLGWQIEVHCEAQRLPRVVGPLLDRHGEPIDVVVDHFGRPQPALGVDDPGFRYLLTLGATRRVWVKVSGAYRNAVAKTGPDANGAATALAAMPLLEDAFGFDRLVWGSDWPHTQFEHVESYDAVYALMLKLLPTERARRAVLVDTPANLFGFA